MAKFKIQAECLRETEKALLVEIGEKEHWIPKRLVDDDSEVYGEGMTGKLVIPDWKADEMGLEEEAKKELEA